MNNMGTEIASMSHATFQDIKGKDTISGDIISHLRYIQLYDPLDLEGEGKKFGNDISEELPPQRQRLIWK